MQFANLERPSIEITVRGRSNGGSVIYSVADNGLGIKRSELPRIWELFYRGSLPAGVDGEGVGLPLVRRLAARNYGKIWAESELGQGSTFYIEMPAPAGGQAQLPH